MKRRLFLITTVLVLLCTLLAGCGGYAPGGPKVESGDYVQAVLLYDGAGTLTADEIFRRFWRIGEDGSLQYKLETAEEFVDCGMPKNYYVSPEDFKEAFANPQQLISAEYLLNAITDGKRYNCDGYDIVLLRAGEESTLLATMEGDQATALFLLEQGEIPPTAIPLAYEWDPYAVSDIYSNIFGHRFESDFRSMVQAIMNGDNTFYCSDSSNAARLHAYGDAIFPPYSQLVANIFFDEGYAHIIYKTFFDADRLAVLDEFQRSIEYLVRSALKEGDSPATMAIALYHAYAYQITEDEGVFHDDKNLTTFRAMTRYAGVAKNFATAYAYLCTQMDINAVPVGGLSAYNVSHDWTLLQFEGRYYYADPTWESRAGGTGLRYFGMSTQQRYDDDKFLAHYTNVANSNVLWGNNIDVSDEQFRPLQEIVDIQQMWRTNGNLTIRGINKAGEIVTLTVQEAAAP